MQNRKLKLKATTCGKAAALHNLASEMEEFSDRTVRYLKCLLKEKENGGCRKSVGVQDVEV